jgi:hypothetical protein
MVTKKPKAEKKSWKVIHNCVEKNQYMYERKRCKKYRNVYHMRVSERENDGRIKEIIEIIIEYIFTQLKKTLNFQMLYKLLPSIFSH